MPLSSPSLTLSETDCASLQIVVHRGRASACKLARPRILLKLAESWSKEDFNIGRKGSQKASVGS